MKALGVKPNRRTCAALARKRTPALHQEEVILVVARRIEQWIDREKRFLGLRGSAFIPPGVVHASFNVDDGEATILTIFGPCAGDGFEIVDIASEAPWNSLRS